MGIFSNMFAPDEAEDSLGNEIRSALGVLVRRALEGGEGSLILTTWRCKLRGIPVGSWRFTVERVPDNEKEQGNNSQ